MDLYIKLTNSAKTTVELLLSTNENNNCKKIQYSTVNTVVIPPTY